MAPLRHADGHWECLFIGLDEEADIAKTSMDTIEVAETLLILRL